MPSFPATVLTPHAPFASPFTACRRHTLLITPVVMPSHYATFHHAIFAARRLDAT